MTYLQMDSFEVQDFLDHVQQGETIRVSFLKQNGEHATYEGTLDVGANRSQSVAIYTDEGWKRFSVNRVTQIEKVE